MAVSWRDALKQAAVPAPTLAGPAPIDPGAVSPGLQALLDERQAMEATMAGLTGQGDTADPRFAVTPLVQRRAELARWAAARDAARPAPKPPEPERAVLITGEPDPVPADRSAGGRGLPERGAHSTTDRVPPERAMLDRLLPDRSVAGRMLAAFAPARGDPSLRTTAGESVGGTPIGPDAFGTLRDRARDEALRRAPERGDASGFTERAFDRIAKRAAKPLGGEAAIERAKSAIPDDWRARARKMVPTLDDSSYAKRAKKLLGVDVGTLEELAERAEKLRDTLRDVRELKAADEAGDDKRRDRALEKLKAKRQEDA